ncbi:hypothetical protein Tco_0586982 [Tanacetum coccineum]
MSHSHSVKGNWGSTVKTSAGYNWRNSKPNFNCDSGPIFIRTVNAKAKGSTQLKRPGHMTGTRIKLEDVEEFNGNRDYRLNFVEQGYKTELYSNAELHTDEVAERMNRTLIEVARTMLADSLLPTTFWAEAVSTALLYFYRGFLRRISNQHAGTSEVTNRAGTSQTQSSNASEEKDEEVELIVVPSTVRNTEEIAESRKSSTNSKKEEILIDASLDDLPMQELEIFHNLPTEIEVSPTPTLRIHNIHPKSQILGEEPKKIAEALQDDSWVQAMQEELLQFKLQQVWVLVDLPHGMKALGPRAGFCYYSINNSSEAWIQRGTYDKTLFIKRDKTDNHALFKYESYGRESHFSLGLQVKQNKARFFSALGNEEAVDVDMNYTDPVTPKTSHLNAVKRIFKYLKGKPNLGLWYPRESPFDLEAFSDSDYGGSNLDRKSTTGGCQFLGQRLISWQCKNLDDSGFFLTELTMLLLQIVVDKNSMDLQLKGRNMKRGFRGVSRPLLPAMLLVTNPNAGQEHPDVAQSQPSSSTIPVPSSPPVQSPPPIPTPIPASTPIPETDHEPLEHTFEEPFCTQHLSTTQEACPKDR